MSIALPSSSGQGISQCLEDAEALSLLMLNSLQTAGGRTPDSQMLKKTFKQYMQVRKSHVEEVLDAGNRAGDTSRDMGFAKEFMMYGFMWVACKRFPKVKPSLID